MLKRTAQLCSQSSQACALRQNIAASSTVRTGVHDLQQCRMLASRGRRDDRSANEMTWTELGLQALDKLKQIPVIGNAISKFLPGSNKPSAQSGSQRPFGGQISDSVQACSMAGLFGGGLMGRMMERTVGKAMEGAINSMGEQLRAAQSQAKSIKEEAARAIASDSEVLRHLGGSVQIADPVSQQSSTQIINGRTMQTVVLTLPVIGSSGLRAHAQVSSTEQGELDIQVQLSNGRVIQVGANDDFDQLPGNDEYAPKGRVVDADWREVR